MLTYRTHILLDQNTSRTLKNLAKTQKTTVGKLVRAAIRKIYLTPDPYANRKLALQQVYKIRPEISNNPIDYKALINYSRK